MSSYHDTDTFSFETLSDEDLFSSARENAELFSILLKRYQSAFVSRARSILKNQEDAEDAVQETFLRIYLKSHKFTPQGQGSFRSWAYVILFTSSISILRKRGKGVVPLLEEYSEILPDPETIGTLEKKGLADYVASILSRMPEGLAKTLSSFLLDEKTQEEISKEEGISVSAVKSKVFRAKESFRSVDRELSRKEYLSLL